MKVLSIIPARGGSKGLPQKNIIDFMGKPLIAWTIEASRCSKYITRTIVSSDDDKILKTASDYGADIIKRPEKLALDTTPTEPVIQHILDNTADIEKYDYFILLQPTSPLRDTSDIDTSFELLLQKKATGLISTKKINNNILKAFKIHNGYLKGIANNYYPFTRRQDLPNVYLPNGAIYIVNIQEFLQTSTLLTDKTISFVMSEDKSIDIDSLDDIERCRKKMTVQEARKECL